MFKRELLIKVIKSHLIVHFLKRMFIYHFVGASEYDLVSRYQNEPHVTREIAPGQTSGKKKVLNNLKINFHMISFTGKKCFNKSSSLYCKK